MMSLRCTAPDASESTREADAARTAASCRSSRGDDGGVEVRYVLSEPNT